MSDGGLRPGLRCPVCDRDVLLVFHDWKGSENVAVFEYHHTDDPDVDIPSPCVKTMGYDEGLQRFEIESAPFHRVPL